MNNSVRLILAACTLAIGSLAPVKAEMPAPPPAAGVPAAPSGVPLNAAATPTTAAPTTSARSYSYYGERYRDPFIALIGDVRPDASLDRPPAIASLTLKGIVQDANGRMALLVSGINSYILRGGRLYDGRNRMVKKISGVIKTDSVVLVGADRTVRELRTRATL